MLATLVVGIAPALSSVTARCSPGFVSERDPLGSGCGFKTEGGWCLEHVDGKDRRESPTWVEGHPLPVGERRRVRMEVEPRAVRVLLDGKKLIDWSGDPQRLSLPEDWNVPHDRRLHIGSNGEFRVHGIVLETR